MTIKSAPFYWLECDGCGVKSTEDGDVGAWYEVSHAKDEASESDWRLAENTDYPTKHYEGDRGQTITVQGNEGHYCPECMPPWCLECERPITEDNPRVLDSDGDPDNWECRGCAA